MKLSRNSLVTALSMSVIPLAGLWVPLCMGQEAGGQTASTVSGAGKPGYIAIWKNSSTLTNSQLFQSGGSVGIGTTTPAARLEVNGNAQVDGNLELAGNILSGPGSLGSTPVIQAPNDSMFNFSAGLGALGSPSTGLYDTAVGDFALALNQAGIENVAVGESALFLNSGGSNNVAVGYGALINNANGNNNTAVGSGALLGGQNTTGSSNTALGYNAGASLVSGSNNIYIANSGGNSETGVTRIGTTGTQTTTFIAGIRGVTTGDRNAVAVMIDSNGQLGTISSSRRFKEDIQDMGDASSGLMHLRPVTFRYKRAFDDGSKPVQYGLIAEEVAEVYPDLVARSADGQVETVKYQLLDAMLINELQKQNVTITAQKEQLRAQEQQIQSLAERLAAVEAALRQSPVTTSSH
jgi:Chaperone of endosialidase